MAILFGTPNSRGLISTVHFQMVVATIDHLRRKRPNQPVVHKIANGSLIGFCRNALASHALADPSVSHLLLVDPDMSIPADVVDQMLTFDKPVVACPYPTRDWNRQAFAEAARRVDDASLAEACAATYVGGDEDLVMAPGPNGPQPVSRGAFAKVRSCGAGVLLIRRDALERLAAKRPDIVIREKRNDYAKLGYEGDVIIECFEHASVRRSDEVAEGAAFARFWTEDCGGEIWTHMEAPVSRFSEYRFVGHFASKLRLGFL
ncbi:hypothetical protein [Chthonobacter rhizosphaerae]|uniref:hypothetical protein n=1 Tax=Chthonobacter rhizosphaerae TaxID=2735553 RepID=UPI0015EFA72C|nr:hypothetical protein [Chthonobacter rhizosphaerae]